MKSNKSILLLAATVVLLAILAGVCAALLSGGDSPPGETPSESSREIPTAGSTAVPRTEPDADWGNTVEIDGVMYRLNPDLETVLFRLMRGTGLPGLCGIPLCRGRILRPLLFCEKKDILRACREKNIPFVTDSTNNDLSAARNYLRQEIVPRLKSKNPSIVSHVSDMTRRLNRDEAFLKAEAGRYSLSDGRRALSALPDALLTRLLIREMVSAGITPDDEHVENAVGILRSDSVRTHLSCPGGLMTVDRDTVRFSAWQESPPPISERPIGPGLTELDGGSALYLGTPFGDASKDINMLKNIYKFAIQESVDSAKIETVSLRVRGRLPGDVYRLGGMTRQVKKLLQSKKTALRDRTSLPFLLAGDEILWIPGFPVSDGFRPDGRETTVPLVFFFEKNETTDKSERVSHAET